MLRRGMLRSAMPSSSGGGVVLRASGGPSILKELSNEQIAVDIEDCLRLNVDAMAVQVFVGGEYESQTVHNLTRLVDAGNRYGIVTLGVTAVGKAMTRDARYLRLACRISAELGAQVVKTYYVGEGFETVTASCPVPVVMAGGKKIAELDALKMAYNAISQGAAGVDMGRNIFQSEAPAAMIQAVGKVVHESMKPEQAYEFYLRTARLDLDDYNNDTEEGCHITSMAGTWMSVVKGFGGMRVRNGQLHINAFLPDKWKSYSFRLEFRDRVLKIKVTADGVVSFVGRETGYGNVIMVKHSGHFSTVYGHLSRFARHLHR